MIFSEDSRVKTPCVLHLMRLGYSYPLAYGGKELIDKFSVVIKPMLKQMYVLENENQQLAQLRDWLLPLLMNGQVTVA